MSRWFVAGVTLAAILACGGGASDVPLGPPDVTTTCAAMMDDGAAGFSKYDGKQVLVTGKFRGSNSNFEMETGGKSTTRCKLSMKTGEPKTGLEGTMGAVQCTAEAFNDPFGPDLSHCRHVKGADVPEPEPAGDDDDDKGGKGGKSKGGKGKESKGGKSKGGKSKGGKGKGR